MYGQEGVPSWERLSQFLAISWVLAERIPEISDIAKEIFRSFLPQQKLPHIFLDIARFFLLGEKMHNEAKWGHSAAFFCVFSDFLSELGAKEIWILKELEVQILTCVQLLRNMGILHNDYTRSKQHLCTFLHFVFMFAVAVSLICICLRSG